MISTNSLLFRATIVAICTYTSFAAAQIVIDGAWDDDYGDPVVTQTVNTGFGDNQSELNAAYVHQDGARLNILFTGNLEQNFNKMEIFFDSVAGGENVLSATPEYDFANLSTNLGGMTFDTGFEADYHMFLRGGNVGGNDIFDVDFVDRAGGANAAVKSNGVSVAYDAAMKTGSGEIKAGDLPGTAGDTLTDSISFAMNNNNNVGVTDVIAEAVNEFNVLNAANGFEFSIALADLGLNPTVANSIKISVMINNADHNYLSNQVLGGLPAATGNLGGDQSGNFTGTLADIDFTDLAGDQFFTLDLAAVSGGALVCDADGDGDCQADDLAALYSQAGTAGTLDLDGSGNVDGGDVDDWLLAASSAANPGKSDSAHVYKVGDTDLNGAVDSTDLGALLNNFGSMAGLGFAKGDLNLDLNVDSSDLGLLLNNFGFASTASAAATVPEPDSTVLLLLSSVALLFRSRRPNGSRWSRRS